MDVKMACPGKHLLHFYSEELIFSLPLSNTRKGLRRNVHGLLRSSKVQEEIKSHIPASVLCLDLTRSAGVGFLIPLPAVKSAGQSAIRGDKLATPPARFLSFRVQDGVPPEVRPHDTLSPIVTTLKGLESEDDEAPLESGSLWGQASLVSADGRVAMALAVPDILSGVIVAPLVRSHESWLLVFDKLVIRQSGYFKIHIALMQTSRREAEGEGENVIEAPQELLSITTSLIHVHSFARMPR